MNTLYEKYNLKPFGAIPNERQLEWFERKRTIFFHFGMNTFTDKEWGDGSESPSQFNPTELNVEQWVKAIKDGGFTTAILTAKHHDGFCLWQTKYTEHSIKNSPYKNGKGDIVREFFDACEKYGIKAGIYLSPWDRHEKTWGTDAYNDFYVGQLTELFTNYGKIWECWWDGAGSTEAVYDWERWAKVVRTLQPDAVIFGSLGATPWVDIRWVGNEKGVAGKPCYCTIDPISLEIETTDELNHGKKGGKRFIPAEVDVSIRPGWFYHSDQDNLVRTPENLINLWFTSIGSNAGFLLNLPPDRRGLIHENDVKSIKRFADILDSTLENNLAIDGEFFGEHLYDCVASNLVAKDKFYLPCGNNFEVKLPKKKSFNTLIIGEGIELGHKVTKISAYAVLEDSEILLFKREIIGHTLAERFDTVTCDRVRIEIEYDDTPVLKGFGLYLFEAEEEKKVKSGKNLLEGKCAKVEISSKQIDVNLGGLFPFDRIYVHGVGKNAYKLHIFNGFSFDVVKEGICEGDDLEIKLDSIIDSSYKLKLEFEKEINKDTKIEVL